LKDLEFTAAVTITAAGTKFDGCAKRLLEDLAFEITDGFVHFGEEREGAAGFAENGETIVEFSLNGKATGPHFLGEQINAAIDGVDGGERPLELFGKAVLDTLHQLLADDGVFKLGNGLPEHHRELAVVFTKGMEAFRGDAIDVPGASARLALEFRGDESGGFETRDTLADGRASDAEEVADGLHIGTAGAVEV
jgi:hypothetical protein